MKTENNYTIESIFGLTNLNKTPEWSTLYSSEQRKCTKGDRIIGQIADLIFSNIAGSKTIKIQTI